jgi:hypothetical protein
MPPVLQAAHALCWPGDDMRYAGGHLLLAARAPERLRRAGTGDVADEPFAVAVELAAFDPTDGAVQIKPGALGTSSVGSGHGSRISGRRGEGSGHA